MTDTELNESVARKLGWLRTPLNEFVPDYCHSIAAAWEIVEKLRPNIVLYDLGRKWVVSRSCYEGIGETLGEAATAPMAICLAFLKLT